MELKVTHIEGTIPQLSFVCSNNNGNIQQSDLLLNFGGADQNSNQVIFSLYADNFPITNDTAFQVATAAIADEDGNIYHIRHSAQPSISINGNEVTLIYTDCLLPLNGTNGTITVKFINQL